ncbi:MAG: DUF1722 domain-containing protein [Gammaproteobacteria bacterium]|nr:DUF1722 domain-containing protein [Gammaproteobacteria bacterium]
MKPAAPIRLGISSCLLGQKVRYDGNHQHDRLITGTLGKYFEFVPVCPEVAIGLGVPRPPIRLVGNPAAPRAVGVADPTLDVTRQLANYGTRMARALDDISGYILKSRSPSCGVEQVKVYDSRDRVRNGRGVYATAFLAQRPLLPVQEEARLDDPELRSNFIERVFAYRRWQALVESGLTVPRLVEFHSAHRLALLTHGERPYRELGIFIAHVSRRNTRHVGADYLRLFMAALQCRATRTRHANVLQRAAGYLKKDLKPNEKAELFGLIGAYRRGATPLAAPVIRLRRYALRHSDPRLLTQTYLYPEPPEFNLRYRI